MIKILKCCPQCKALSATLERITKEYNRLVGNQSYATINKIINHDTI